MSGNKTGSSTPTAGQCYVCRVWTTKRYGGEGRYAAMCWDCWARGGVYPSECRNPERCLAAGSCRCAAADEPGETRGGVSPPGKEQP